jgi:uroporphyrinogen decarboxylase
MTIYSPLTLAYKLAGDLLLEHLKHHATDVQIGLATIAETTARFAEAVLEAGADGIFFTSQLSRGDMLSAEACQRFVVRYDLIALERVKALPAPLVLHLHGKHIYFDTVNQYPAHAVSWHNHETPPSLLEALALTDKTIFTGLDRDTFAQGTPQELVAQVTEAIEESGGRRLILAPACVIPPAATPEHLRAVAEVNRSIGANQYEQT